MENAVDALKMAAGLLIFVLALSISINAFGNVRMTSQAILDYRDREFIYDWVEDNGNTERIVGVDSIIPTIYKAYTENYKIIFDKNILSSGLYRKDNNGDGDTDDEVDRIFEIDLEKEGLANNTQKKDFIGYILYGDDYIGSTTIGNIQSNLGITLQEDGIYGIIKREMFKESLGVYYQEDITEDQEESANEDIPEVNKTKKRVITYSNP